MVPTRSELKVQPAPAEQRQQDPVDLEQGRIEPTLRVTKISSQLQNARQTREDNLLRDYSRRTRAGTISGSVLGRHASSIAPPLSPQSEAVEEEDLGMGPLAQQGSIQAEHGFSVQQPGMQHWYPDDAASAITEKEEDGDLDGDYLKDTLPLKAYEAEEDEVHNLHTHWSVIRLRFREPLAELLAVSPSIPI